MHAKTAQHVLRLLLPSQGIDIGGHRKSLTELIEATDCSEAELEEVLALLDHELRLITPIDQDVGSSNPNTSVDSTQAAYQLTHDFLVPAIRKWVRRNQMSTRRGRAELQLQDRTKLWLAYKEKKQLPTTAELLSIRAFTNSSEWTQPQKEMMRRTTALHRFRWTSALIVILSLAVTIGFAIRRDQTNQQEKVFAQVDQLLKSPASEVEAGVKTISPLREETHRVLLDRFEDDSAQDSLRLRAAIVLSELGEKKQDFIIGHIDAAAADEASNIIRALRVSRKESLREVDVAFNNTQDKRQKAKLATAALHLGEARHAQEMLKNRANPTQRSKYINYIPTWYGDIADFVQAPSVETDSDYRTGVCLALGSLTPNPEQLREITPVVRHWYRTHPDGGTHSAAGWLLQRWGQALPPIAASNGSQIGNREWYVNKTGMTMIRLEPKDGRPFDLCATEVSRGLYQEFVNDEIYPSELRPVRFKGADIQKSPSLRHPVQRVCWVNAALFCNWLSVKEGLSPCYDTNGTTPLSVQSELELIPDSSGYRLPFEDEWEFACRANTKTDYFFGDDISLLPDYGVFEGNKAEPCAAKRPNPWGFFDMPGNVNEWCQDKVPPEEHPENIRPQRRIRSGAFPHDAEYTTSWCEHKAEVSWDTHAMGLRVARNYQGSQTTIPAGQEDSAVKNQKK